MRYSIKEYGRSCHKQWGVYDGDELVCVCAYKCGAGMGACMDIDHRALVAKAWEVVK